MHACTYYSILGVLCLLLTAEVLSSASDRSGTPSQVQGRQVEQGCHSAQHMLVNSIPLSCNDGLRAAVSSLPNITTVPDLHNLCQTYCLYPLHQAAADCTAIRDTEEVVRGLCTKYRGIRCFNLVTNEASLNLVHYCGNVSNCTVGESGLLCPENCSAALKEAREELGCCINAVFNTTSLQSSYSFTESWVWQLCNQSQPHACTNHSSAIRAPGAWLTIPTLAGVLMFHVVQRMYV